MQRMTLRQGNPQQQSVTDVNNVAVGTKRYHLVAVGTGNRVPPLWPAESLWVPLQVI